MALYPCLCGSAVYIFVKSGVEAVSKCNKFAMQQLRYFVSFLFQLVHDLKV